MENQNALETLLSDYQIRKSKKQKLRFISFVKDLCSGLGLPCHIEETTNIICNRNIVVGDIQKARIIFTAHYDTCGWMPFPNFITPKNIFIFLLYQFFMVGILVAISYGIASLTTLFTDNRFFFVIILELFLFAFLFQIMFGYPNKHTANDNTSGVATLLCLMQSIPVEDWDKVAFVFFDYEEIGLIGSSAFKSLHKKEIADKLVINFDCVSDGDHFIFISKKQAINSEEYPLLKDIIRKEAPDFGKNQEFATVWQAFCPSDQMLYPKSIGVMAFKKAPVLGLYLDRIHTSFDTQFDRNNLAFLCRCFTKFVSLIKM